MGDTANGWLTNPHMLTWAHYLYKYRSSTARWSVESGWMMKMFDKPNTNPSCFADGDTEPWPAWWTVDYVMMPVNVDMVHWVLAILDLHTWTVSIFDSLSSEVVQPSVSDIFKRYWRWLPKFLDDIHYWDISGRERSKLTELTLIGEKVPIQSGRLGDCGIWVMIHMENKIRSRRMRSCVDPAAYAKNMRVRVASVFFSFVTRIDPE